MKTQFNDPLLLAGKVLTIIMQGVMAFAAAVLVILVPIVVIFKDEINTEITAEHADIIGAFPTMPIVGLFALAIAALVLAFFFFDKLRKIIGTVSEQDPFTPENARRLSAMAWIMLAIQILMIPLAGLGLMIAKWADQFEQSDVTVDAGLDLSGILMIVVLFILARVFKHGAAMREDLEGTV